MIALEGSTLTFRFPEVHEDAVLRISFQRTLRVPDDGRIYPLPAGLGTFPLRHADDHSKKLPAHILKRGGVLTPMWQAEAMWLRFRTDYPFAVKIATGKVNAVTGKEWSELLNTDPQDYLVAPTQPWLDGYCVEKGRIRQFVAMPLGNGQTVEEQFTGRAEHGGMQILVYPVKPEHYKPYRPRGFCEELDLYSLHPSALEMGLAAGGTIRQELYEDPYGRDAWHAASSRVFVSVLNAEHWMDVTGQLPLSDPITAKKYADAGLPWFDWYAADQKALKGALRLKKLKKLVGLGSQSHDEWSAPLESVNTTNIGPHVRPIREFEELTTDQKSGS